MARETAICIRVTPEEKAAFQKAADHAQRKVSDWARLELIRVVSPDGLIIERQELQWPSQTTKNAI